MKKLLNEVQFIDDCITDLGVKIENNGINSNIKVKLACEILYRAGMQLSAIVTKCQNQYALYQVAASLSIYIKSEKLAVKAVQALAEDIGLILQELMDRLDNNYGLSEILVSLPKVSVQKIKEYLIDIKYNNEIFCRNGDVCYVVCRPPVDFNDIEYPLCYEDEVE